MLNVERVACTAIPRQSPVCSAGAKWELPRFDIGGDREVFSDRSSLAVLCPSMFKFSLRLILKSKDDKALAGFVTSV